MYSLVLLVSGVDDAEMVFGNDVVTGESEDDPNLNGEYNVLESSETLNGEFGFVVESEHHHNVHHHQHRRVSCSVCHGRGRSFLVERRSLKLGC